MSDTPLDYFLETVDPDGCHLINLPDRLWVFGGPCNPNLKESTLSLRDSFWRQTFNATTHKDWHGLLDRPEGYPDWWAFSGYNDLLEFERDACYLAKGIILFSESPGSHAELGALALDNSIVPRLFVVVQSQYLQENTRESFLNLGPLKRVVSNGTRCVISTTEKNRLPADDYETIADELDKFILSSEPKSQKLDKNNPTHILLLMADIVDILLVSKTSEMRQALSHFGMEIEEIALIRSINLLNFFHFVQMEHRGSELFFVRRRSTLAPWVRYTSKAATPSFDRARFKTRCQEWIDDSRRHKSILERQP